MSGRCRREVMTMREIELRAQVVAVAKALTGGRGEPSHLRVLDT